MVQLQTDICAEQRPTQHSPTHFFPFEAMSEEGKQQGLTTEIVGTGMDAQ